MRHINITAASLFFFLFLAGCGGGGGSGPEGVPGQAAIDGWWEYLIREPAGSGDYVARSIILLEQVGAEVQLLDVPLLRGGHALTGAYPDFHTAAREEYHLRIASASLIEGEIVNYVGTPEPGRADVLLRRVETPDGRFTAYGQTSSGPIDFSTSMAYAERRPHGIFPHWSDVSIVDAVGEDVHTLRFGHSPYSSGDTSPMVAIGGQFIRNGHTDPAVAGSLTRTPAAPGRIAGTYNMTLAGGQVITGMFDVPLLIDR